MVNPDRVAFTLFGKDVYWYGIIIAVGIVLAIFLASKESKRKKLPADTIVDLALIAIPCGVIGARLYYVLCELDHYIDNPISMLYIWEGGLAIYGAIIAGVIAAIVYSIVKKQSFLRIADCVVPGLVLAQGLGRWGNFFNQEAFGLPVGENLAWFPLAVRIDGYHTFNGAECLEPYHLATFFYESMWCILIFILIWSLRKKFKHDGDAVLTYALLYSFERAIVEGLRGDSLYLGGTDIRISQLLSAIVFLAVLSFFIIRAIKEKKAGYLMWPKIAAEAAVEVEADEAFEADETLDAQESDISSEISEENK
ncbi:MAG: prolipoprotein diacylglyceryl transferase [Clostridia bacterium]|nr:prolipoprotein diacylglyceryl transferase [Clostridia bacterium]